MSNINEFAKANKAAIINALIGQGQDEPVIIVDEVERIIYDNFGLLLHECMQKTRKRKYVAARYVISIIERESSGLSFAQCGGKIGKDHSTVMHGVKAINNILETKTPKDLYEMVSGCFKDLNLSI